MSGPQTHLDSAVVDVTWLKQEQKVHFWASWIKTHSVLLLGLATQELRTWN